MNQRDIFEQAYLDHGDSIFRYVYYRVFDRDLARDLTQETFYKVWDYLAKGKTIDQIKPFLFRTAHNVMVNALRAKRQTLSLDDLHETMGFDAEDAQGAESLEKARDVKEVIESFSILSRPDAELMKLRYVDGLSVQEISSVTKMSENSISVKIHRLIARLKEYHNNHET